VAPMTDAEEEGQTAKHIAGKNYIRGLLMLYMRYIQNFFSSIVLMHDHHSSGYFVQTWLCCACGSGGHACKRIGRFGAH
jgi:hypothetical protein